MLTSFTTNSTNISIIWDYEEDQAEGGSTCGDLKYSPLTTALLAIIISSVALTTIVGNTLVIAAFATDKKLRLFGNYFILNLAISDLIVGLLIFAYTPYLLIGCWQLTRVGCLTFLFLDYVVPLASAWNMALISLDRYKSNQIKYKSNRIIYFFSLV